MLKAEVRFLAELVFGFCFLYYNDIFNSDSETPIFIVTWFVRDDISRCKRDFGVLNSGADSDRTFVNI
jgi:hypothetical protein